MMIPKNSKKTLAVLLTDILVATGHISLLFAQHTAIIQGIVVSKDTNEPLAGANIVLLGTNWGAAADSGGHYCIENIPVGKYTIEASRIGFKPMRIEGLSI